MNSRTWKLRDGPLLQFLLRKLESGEEYLDRYELLPHWSAAVQFYVQWKPGGGDISVPHPLTHAQVKEFASRIIAKSGES